MNFDANHIYIAITVAVALAVLWSTIRYGLRWRREYTTLREEKQRADLVAEWSKPVVWDVKVHDGICSFLALEGNHHRKHSWTHEAIIEAELREGRYGANYTRAARVEHALRFAGVKPRVANEYQLGGEYVQEWYFPLPEMFDSSKLGGWFYIRNQPNWDLKGPPRRETGVPKPPERS
jgi:hypothetical protein